MACLCWTGGGEQEFDAVETVPPRDFGKITVCGSLGILFSILLSVHLHQVILCYSRISLLKSGILLLNSANLRID